MGRIVRGERCGMGTKVGVKGRVITVGRYFILIWLDLGDHSLFNEGGWEDFAEGHMVFMRKGGGQSSSTEDTGRTIED